MDQVNHFAYGSGLVLLIESAPFFLPPANNIAPPSLFRSLSTRQAHLLPYLPEDNLDGGLTVASNLADRLGVLLSKDEAAFWAVVKTDR